VPVETDFLRLITEATVPGIAAAIIRDGRLDRYVCCGVRTAEAAAAVDENTVFDAASLTKPVFAHAVLQLVDQGCLSLDAALGEYLPNYVAADSRASSITPRQVLCHTTGLPNWRNADLPLKTYFPPGAQFSYSGEGYLYLQKAVEAITGEKAHTLVEQLVFQPFAMTQSSLIWNPRLDANRAYPHDAFGRRALLFKPGEANAAGSLQTTATDYARFLLGVLDGSRLKPDSAQLWLRPQIQIKHRGAQQLASSANDVVTGVAWGLGWGLEPCEGTFFHWGDNGPVTAFTIGSIQKRDALVLFTNGASGLSIMPELVARFIPGNRPSLDWLNYGRHDSPLRRLMRAARTHGVQAAWREIENANLDADDLRWIARGLNAAGREEDSLWLRAHIENLRSAGRGKE
jgi:CubicO group peptidase (beta-lactamase class C family)